MQNKKLNLSIISISISIIVISLFTICLSSNSAMAIECIDGTQIPAYYQPYTPCDEPAITILPNGCIVSYEYCYRCDCPPNATSSTYCYFDCYISSISITGDPAKGCVTPTFPFDVDEYNDLYGACLADLVMRNPWTECVPPMSLDIPNCDANSNIVYRAGRPSCTSDWYTVWGPGAGANSDYVIWRKTSPCNVTGLSYYCFNTYRYCWELDVATGNYVLKATQLSSGSPSTYQCPSVYVPKNESLVPPNQVIGCNPICGD
jgi:hypothetical protein